MADAAGQVPRLVEAAGALLWRPGGDGPEVLLVHRSRYDDWSFPKGKRAPGEHILLTAVREVTEETGIRPLLGRRLSTSSYLTDGYRKRVDFWAARAAGGESGATGGPPAGFLPNDEVDGARWVGLADARKLASYDHDVSLLEEFAAAPARTAPVIVLRHAFAEGKREWREAGHPDLARPLSASGQAQAAALAGVLSCFPPARVISSAAQRCVATVRPYAELTGARVEPEPGLALDSSRPAGDEDWAATPAVRQRITRAVAAGRPVITCAHRQNLPPLLALVCAALGAPVPEGPPLRQGAFWVLHAGEGGLVCSERHDVDAGEQARA
jgi:8-oxo-(d)GTP phosphatase